MADEGRGRIGVVDPETGSNYDSTPEVKASSSRYIRTWDLHFLLSSASEPIFTILVGVQALPYNKLLGAAALVVAICSILVMIWYRYKMVQANLTSKAAIKDWRRHEKLGTHVVNGLSLGIAGLAAGLVPEVREQLVHDPSTFIFLGSGSLLDIYDIICFLQGFEDEPLALTCWDISTCFFWVPVYLFRLFVVRLARGWEEAAQYESEAGKQMVELGTYIESLGIDMVVWFGSLRSSNPMPSNVGGVNNNMHGKDNLKRGAKGPRAALGDISNRSLGVGFGDKGTKKQHTVAKPFSVAVEEKEKPTRFLEKNHSPTNFEDDTSSKMEMATPGPEKSNNHTHRVPATNIDIADENDLSNPKYAAEYVGDIYSHYRKVETKYLAGPDYMSTQTDINEKMRALLIDWLVQVHVKFELLPQTLYLTVNLLDRFLERKVVPRRKLQLVGCAAMLLASKYEEIYAPEAPDFVSMSDKAFTAEELLKMEGVMLNVLDFHLTTPSPYTFLRRFMKVACSSAKTQHFATYLVERSLQEYRMLTFRPSLVAAAALYIAQSLTDSRKSWGHTLTRHAGYGPEDIEECMSTMKTLYSTNQKNYLQAVNKKYSSSKYMHVSTIELV
ncbi:G2/mitotic-specific cyclin-1 [Hondaea fermentalgiana]|uniref:G2/mitotic-specific cyclin-1 n=1 Tax=Hondaea fermentalgiana TaxID=2315210 RepID=A0A2R5GFS0_9STRA|nr:G2/mitotic-specific cyclin-1 [Hondaea fermentalgiana]|eukprot:GBG29425.1 G2/mitotic-specific cyclin-1 [Hondaea fermentalgiana]